MLSFIDALKQIIADIQTTGGMTIERTSPSPQLLQKLREHAVQQLAEAKSDFFSLEEWFISGSFDEHVRVCIVHLHKLGISQDERTYHLISKVIDAVVKDNYVGANPRGQDNQHFETQLIRSLMIVWEDMGDDQTFLYTAAQNRLLISWDYQKSLWKSTGLGRMFMELSTVQAAIFFLSVDASFAAGRRDFHHISKYMLNYLQSLHSGANTKALFEKPLEFLLYPHQNLLTRLGILFTDVDVTDSEEDLFNSIHLTPIGQTVLRAVLDQDNPFRDTALAIIQTEEVGGTFNESTSEIDHILHLSNQNHLIDQANRESIEAGVRFYHTGKYLNSLRMIYPSIEAIINIMLIEVGEVPEQGLAAKAHKLFQHGVIPYDVAYAMEVFTGRNKVVHGNFSPPEDYVFPLCLHAFRYLRRLLTEYHPKS